MSSLLQERLKHEAQWRRAIFFIICSQQKQITYCVRLQTHLWKFIQQEKPQHSGRGVQEEEQQWYLFFSKAVEGQLFLYSVASVDHQTGVCRAEGSQAGRWAVIL